MSKLVSRGQRLSRDFFLCIGGGFVLIAAGALAGNLPDILKYHDWPAYELKELYATVSRFAIFGIISLAAAYALFRSRRWGAYLATGVSTLALAVIALTWWNEPFNLPGYEFVPLFWSLPFFFTLI